MYKKYSLAHIQGQNEKNKTEMVHEYGWKLILLCMYLRIYSAQYDHAIQKAKKCLPFDALIISKVFYTKQTTPYYEHIKLASQLAKDYM